MGIPMRTPVPIVKIKVGGIYYILGSGNFYKVPETGKKTQLVYCPEGLLVKVVDTFSDPKNEIPMYVDVSIPSGEKIRLRPTRGLLRLSYEPLPQ